MEFQVLRLEAHLTNDQLFWFQVLYQVRSCTQDHGMHRLALSSAGIFLAICSPVSDIILLAIFADIYRGKMGF